MYLRLRSMVKWLLAYVWKDISKTRRWDCFRICTTSWQLSGDIRAYFAVLPFPLAAVSSTPVSLPSVPLSPMLLVLPPTLQQQQLLLSPLISWPLPVLAPQPSQQLPFHSQNVWNCSPSYPSCLSNSISCFSTFAGAAMAIKWNRHQKQISHKYYSQYACVHVCVCLCVWGGGGCIMLRLSK